MQEKFVDIIDKSTMIAPTIPNDVKATKTYEKYLEQCLTTKCIILASMSSKLQRQHEDMDPNCNHRAS